MVRITELVPEILQMVDERQIAFRPAVEVSYLTEEQQYTLLEAIEDGLKKVVDECRFAFENKKFAICADSLVSVIEGILSTFWDDKTNIRMMKICQAKVDELADEKEHITKKYIWVSYNKFIRKLYEKNDFTADEPSFINRHWLLHGRSAYEIEEIDCLRLFNAVSSLCVIVRSESK